MLIQFSRDYRGKLTREIFYEAGTIIEFDNGAASNIIAEGAAIAVEPPSGEQPVEEAPKPKRGRPKKTAEE
jgi:hypothetical protein